MAIVVYDNCDCCGAGTGTIVSTGTGTFGTDPCADMSNTIVAVIDASPGAGSGTAPGVGECDCLAGTYTLTRDVPAPPLPLTNWENNGIGSCVHVGTAFVSCSDNEDGTVTLLLTVTCGADNAGSGSAVVQIADLAALDVTIKIFMTTTVGPCGDCTFQWNEMPMSWALVSSACTGPCICADSSLFTPGTSDGEIRVVSCVPDVTICCEGYISVRLML